MTPLGFSTVAEEQALTTDPEKLPTVVDQYWPHNTVLPP